MSSSNNAKHYIQHWPHGRAPTFKASKESQKTTMETFFKERPRDTTPVVHVCDCRGANEWARGKVAGRIDHRTSVAYSMVRTVVNDSGECSFCGYTAPCYRESQLNADGQLVRGTELKVMSKRPKQELSIGSTYGYLTVKRVFTSAPKRGRGTKMLTVKCECGSTQDMRATYFGKAKSCGCKAYEYHKQLKLGAIARRKGVTDV